MKFIFFDAVTDGEERVEDSHICQLSYLITDNSLEVLTAKNFFFKVKEMTKESAYEQEIIPFTYKRLSKGKVFKDYAKEIYEDFKDAEVFVAHDAWYVSSALEMELSRVGIKERLFKPGSLESTMRIFRNTIQYSDNATTYLTYEFASLDDIAWQLGLGTKYLDAKTKEHFGLIKLDGDIYGNRNSATYQVTQLHEVYSNYVFEYIKTRRPYTEYMVLKED